MNALIVTKELMSNQIILRFGEVPLQSPLYALITKRVAEWDCSRAFALFDEFVATFEDIIKKGKTAEFMLNLFVIATNRKLKDAPTFNLGFFEEIDDVVPMLVLEGDSVTDSDTGIQMPITDEMLNKVGQEIEFYFDFQFIGFRRLVRLRN